MREVLQRRLEILRTELEKGQLELRRVDEQQTYLRETVLRISGAIQVLQDILSEQPGTTIAKDTATIHDGDHISPST